jgi:hypothetical protein
VTAPACLCLDSGVPYGIACCLGAEQVIAELVRQRDAPPDSCACCGLRPPVTDDEMALCDECDQRMAREYVDGGQP